MKDLLYISSRLWDLEGQIMEESSGPSCLKTSDCPLGLRKSLHLYFVKLYVFFLLLLGRISLAEWAFSMENILGLNLPWRSLSSHLVTIDSSGSVDYMSSFDDIRIEKPTKDVSDILVPPKNRIGLMYPLDSL
jgi:hypothetical protein